MTPEAYNKATPIMKSIESYTSQINSVGTANNIKVSIGTTEIGINLATVGDNGLTKVRNAVLDALETRKKQLEDDLSKL